MSDLPSHSPPDWSLIAPSADRDEALSALERCLKELSAAQQTFISSYPSSHGKGVEIAKDNKETPNAVYLRAYHLRARLRRCITKQLGYGKDRRPPGTSS